MTTKNKVDIDPMIAIKEERIKKTRDRKVNLTGKEQSHCKDCNTTKDIIYFDLTTNRNRTTFKPRLVCNPCANKRRKKPKHKSEKGAYKSDPRVKKWVHESAQRACKLITDAYVRRMYHKLGYKAEEITPEMIVAKRLEIMARRESAENKTAETKSKDGTYSKEERDRLSDGYVRGLIKRTVSYQGQEITQEEIEKHRQSIYLKRAVKSKKIRVVKETTVPYVFFVPNECRN